MAFLAALKKIFGKRAEKQLDGMGGRGGGRRGGGRHHGGHGGGHHRRHRHHHGGHWYGGGVPYSYDDYYYREPIVVEVAAPAPLIIVDGQTNAILPVGIKSPRADGSWIRVDSAVENPGGTATLGLSVGKLIGSKTVIVTAGIVDRPPGFPNYRVAFV